MGKYDLPELPSDDELGITDEDRKAMRDLPADRPEMSADELLALLDEAPSAKGRAAGGGAGKSKASKQEPSSKAKGGKPDAAGTTAAEPARPRGGMRGPLTLALLALVVALSSTRFAVPRAVPANASEELFSSARAMATLTDIARRPRPIGSPEHARVRDYLVERLRALGLEAEVQTATSVIEAEEGVRAATVRNVVGRLPGTAPTGTVLVTAHYDSRELAPGAGDDGSGIVAILEALRALETREPLRNDVIVLFTDAEEIGLLGARAFTAEHPWMRDVSVVLSFEMRGGGGPSIMFETGEENGWIVRALRDFDPRPFANSLAYEVYSRMPNDTDFSPFKEVGTQGLNFAGVGRPHVYHQSTDTPANLSEGTLQHHGLRALAGLEHLGRADLRSTDEPNVVYFSVPWLGLFVYDAGWVLPISGGLLVLALGAGLLAVRGGARPARLLVGAGVAILGAALSYGAALLLARSVARFHPEGGSLSGSLYHSEGWYVVGLACAVLALVSGLHVLARRWLRPLELQLGAVFVPLAAALWLTFAAPLAAMNAQWPVGAALVSTIVLALLGARAAGTLGWLVGLVLALPVLVLWTSTIELLWLTLSFRVLPLVAVLMAVVLHLALPAVESLRAPNGWWAPVTGTLACAALVAIGALTAGPSATRPAPSTLVYAHEHGSGAAFWATDPGADPLLDAEAIAWAEAGAGVGFSQTRDLGPFGHPLGVAPAAPAPVVPAERPNVVILLDTLEAERRHVVLGVRSRIGAERVAFQRDSVGRTRFLSVNGVAIERPGAVAWVEHWGVPDSLVVLEVDMPPAEPIGVHVVEHLHRPQELLGRAFDRPADLAPDVSTGSDRALFRFSIARFADPRFAPTAVGETPAGGGTDATTPAPPTTVPAPPL